MRMARRARSSHHSAPFTLSRRSPFSKTTQKVLLWSYFVEFESELTNIRCMVTANFTWFLTKSWHHAARLRLEYRKNNGPNCFKPVLTVHFWCFLDETGFGSQKKCFMNYPIDFLAVAPNCTKITTMSSISVSKSVKHTFHDFGLCFIGSLLSSAFQRT